MFYDAICQGIANTTGLLRMPTKRGRTLYFPKDFAISRELRATLALPASFKPVTRPLRTGPFYHEAVKLSLDYRDARLWLLLEPTVVLTADGENLFQSLEKSALIKVYLSGRFNKVSNQWLDFWMKFLAHSRGKPISIVFPDDDNPEAQFTLSERNAWSRPE
jgi:hypothetical protein